MGLKIDFATEADLAALLVLHTAVNAGLRTQFGKDAWTTTVTERSVARELKTSQILVMRDKGGIVGTLRLATKKPWAIDLAYFTPVGRALYLHAMAVLPECQRAGIGGKLMAEAAAVAKARPADAIRLDAYDGRSGAGPFYAKCGYRERGRTTYRKTPLAYYELLL